MKKSTIIYFLKRSVPAILAVFIVLIVEFAGFNRLFTVGFLSGEAPEILEIEDGSLNNFTYQEDMLIATGWDPKLQFRDLDEEVTLIDINCTPLYSDNSSQIFYSTENDPISEDNSIRFALTSEDNIVVLPQKLLVHDLRFDLATDSGEILRCDNIVLNPKIELQTNFLRYLVYFVLIALFFWFCLTHEPKVWTDWIDRWGKWALLFYGFLIALIDSYFPLVLSYDSGHYLWLSDLIKNNNFSQWDIIRNPIFPLHLNLSKSFFSDSIIGLKIPMVIYHLAIFGILYALILLAANYQSGKAKFWVSTVTFLLIACDPTILGYFHAVLTEYMAATIAALACLLGFKLYKSQFNSKQFWFLNLALILISLVGWHIKQPYLGIGLFPHAIAYLLMLTRRPGVKAWLVGVGIVALLFVTVIGSTMGWELFLEKRGNPLDFSRQFNTWLIRHLSNQYDSPTEQDDLNPLKNTVKKYLTSSNFFYYDRSKKSLVNSPSFTRAAQNSAIAQNIYRIGRRSLVSVPFENATDPYIEISSPPETLNNLFLSRITVSNFLFITGYLSLPLCLIGYLLWFIIKKEPLSAAALILSGSAAGNALIHNISGAGPLDRYFFWGFPLILTTWILVFIAIIGLINGKINSKSKMNQITS